MFNNESFCPAVWSQIEITPQGDFKICCLANYEKDVGLAADRDGRAMNILTHSIQDAINSETHKAHRLQLKQNIKPQRCRNCYDSEDATGGQSLRQRFITETAVIFPEYITVDNADAVTADDGSVSNRVIDLDIRFGNLCNYKCIMCGPIHSNQWYNDWQDIAHLRGDKPGQVSFGVHKIQEIKQDRHKLALEAKNWWETDVWQQKFDEIAPVLRHIYFTGGEPMIVPELPELLDRLIANGHSKNIIIRFDTNMSVINKKIIDKFKEFKRVDLCVSIDDTEDRFGLVRFPGNYNKVVDNIKTVQAAGIPIRYISSCIGVFTPYAMFRVNQLSKDLGIHVMYRFMEKPYSLDPRIWPKVAKQEIIAKYKQELNRETSKTHKVALLSMINLLNKYIDFEDRDRLDQFVELMDILDQNRGTNWRETLPDVHNLINLTHNS